MEISFAGKTALVSGAGGGIGKGIVKQLLKCGAEVIALDKSQELLAELKSEVPTVHTVTADLTNWTSTENALKNVGNIDLLVNNAGVAFLESAANITEEKMKLTFEVNTFGTINLTRIVVGNLLSRKVPGSIVNISSQASMAGLVDHGIYCASKAAVDGFTRCMAVELGPSGIRVNAVNPTVIMTKLGREIWKDPVAAKKMTDNIPLRRFGEVQEVVNTVMFLLSDKASLITGECLRVDGGYVAA